MDYAFAALVVLVVYVLLCKIWPYVLYPNYLKKSKIETYPELVELAAALKNADKLQTIKNAYAYMQETYAGHGDVRDIRNLLTVFKLGDYSTKEILNKKQFLWCHTQNRLLKSILVNTGMFDEDTIEIKKTLLRSVFIHQWVAINLDGRTITIDPYFGVFNTQPLFTK